MNLREWALPVYTILMQLATGTLLMLWVIRATILKRLGSRDVDRILSKPVVIVLITLFAAMIGSHLHLSNPWISFLAVVNLRTSWLSREVFFTVLLFFTTGLLAYFTWFFPGEKRLEKTILGWVAVALGLTSIFCMSNCYRLPAQDAWNQPTTMGLFYCSALLLGGISAFTILVMDAIFAGEYEPDLVAERAGILKRIAWRMVLSLFVLLAVIVAMNVTQISNTKAQDTELARTTLTLLLDVYEPLFIARFITLFAGAASFALVVYWLVQKKKPLNKLVFLTYSTCLLLLMAEISGRFLFYAAHVRLGI